MGYTVVLPSVVEPNRIPAKAIPPGTWFMGRIQAEIKSRLIFKPLGTTYFQFFNVGGVLTFGSEEYVGEIVDYHPVDVEIKVK